MRKIIMLAIMSALLAGCSHLSVTHLPQKAFRLNQTETISMRFWDYKYMGSMENGNFVVSGNAFPNTKVLPGGSWLHNLSLSAYLSDEDGKVLAKDLVTYRVRKLAPEGVMFTFSMSSETVPPDKDTFLTFGYRMSLTDSQFQSPPLRNDFSGEIDVFTAVEGALPR